MTRLLRTFLTLLLAAIAAGADPVAIVVNKNLKPLIQDRLDIYVADLVAEGWAPVVRDWDLTAVGQQKPSDLRGYLAGHAGLKGAVLVGDLPIIHYYNAADWSGAASFPFDLYFMDLNVAWSVRGDGKIDGPAYSGINPGIWVSRIKNSNMTVFGEGEVALMQRYFDKVHRFRTGDLRLPDRSLYWADNDWKSYGTYEMSAAYADNTRITNEIAGVSTDAADWTGRWRQGYETEFFMCHSSATLHLPGGQGVVSGQVAAGDPARLFWNCWNCSGADYTNGNYIAGVRLFTPGYGLNAVGSTKTGSMLGASLFYNDLGLGRCHGEAFRRWFVSYCTDVLWHRGMVMLGDGTLKLGRFHTPAAGATAPTITTIANQTLVAAGSRTIAFTIGDAETPAAKLLVWAESANRTPIPSGNLSCGGSGANRTLTLTALPAVGSSAITVTVWDGKQSASRSFTATTTNAAPVAIADSASVPANGSVLIPVLANDADPDGHAFGIHSRTAPAHGTAVIEGSSIRYTPALAYVGPDSFTYIIRDAIGATASATVSLTVTADLTPPVLLAAVSPGYPTLITVSFSEPVTPGSGSHGSERTGNYALDGGRTVAAAVRSGDGSTVTLTVAPPLTDGTTCTVTVNDIQDVATTPNTIAANSTATFTYRSVDPSLAGWWRLDDGSGLSAADTSGFNHLGSLVGGTTWNPSGVLAGAADLDGVDDHIGIPDFSATSGTMTFTAWVKGVKTADYSGLVFSRSAQPCGLFYGADQNLHYSWNSGASSTWGWNSGLTIPANQWALIAGVVEADKATLYVCSGGSTTVAVNNLAHASQTVNAVRIGSDAHSATRLFKGSIDDVRIYTRALLRCEIQALADGGTTTALPPAITSPLAASGTVGTPFSYTITASNAPIAYGASPLPAGLSRTGAVISGIPSATGTTNTTISATNASGTGAATLAISIAPAPLAQTITFPALAAATYGDADFAPGATASSGLPVAYASSNTAVATFVAGKIHIVGAGTTTITASQAGNASYAAATSQTRVLTIAKAVLTVTADAKSRPFNTANPPLTVTITGYKYSDTASVISGTPVLATTAVLASPVGTYPITVDVAGMAAANYSFVAVSGVLTVGTAAQTITFPALATATYGDADIAPGATASSGLPVAYASSNTAVATIVAGKIHIVGAGTSTITASQAGNASYAAADKTRVLTVGKAWLIVRAIDASRQLNTANPPLTFTITGFKAGDTASVVSGAPLLSTTAVLASPIGTYPISVDTTGMGAANYVISGTAGSLTIRSGPAGVSVHGDGGGGGCGLGGTLSLLMLLFLRLRRNRY